MDGWMDPIVVLFDYLSVSAYCIMSDRYVLALPNVPLVTMWHCREQVRM